MLAENCAEQSTKHYEKLVKKYTKMVRKDIYKEIKKATREGREVTSYTFLTAWYNTDTNMAYRVREIILPELMHQGFYIRTYFLGSPDPETYIISWGSNTIARQKELDRIHAEFIEKQKEKNNDIHD